MSTADGTGWTTDEDRQAPRSAVSLVGGALLLAVGGLFLLLDLTPLEWDAVAPSGRWAGPLLLLGLGGLGLWRALRSEAGPAD